MFPAPAIQKTRNQGDDPFARPVAGACAKRSNAAVSKQERESVRGLARFRSGEHFIGVHSGIDVGPNSSDSAVCAD